MGLYNPQPSPGLVPIGSPWVIGTPVAAVDFTAGIDATYDAYELRYWGVLPSAATQMILRMSTDGGASYSGANGDYSRNAISGQASVGLNAINSGNVIANSVPVTGGYQINATAAMGGASGIIHLFKPSDATAYKGVLYQCIVPVDATSDFCLAIGGGLRLTTTAVNAIRLQTTSGTLVAGSFALFGVKK